MSYNEFVAKKLGEVLAFARVGIDTYEKGHTALLEALGEEKVADVDEKNNMHAQSIIRIATDAGVIDTTLAKAAKTEEKLKAMRELYVGDQWNNATELLEWSGFFEGAAVVHWALIRGCAEALADEKLQELAAEGISTHYSLLEMAEGELHSKGTDNATA